MILGVNIDHVATLRQARLGADPEPVIAASLALMGGADGITVHLREDRRHINDRDLLILKSFITVELNLEMAATTEMVSIARKIRPNLVTIVPEKRKELTTEGGIDVRKHFKTLRQSVRILHDAGIRVSLFINPADADIEAAKRTAADMVEIHTGMYANAEGDQQDRERLRIIRAVKTSRDLSLLPNAGHGLNYQNIGQIAEIEGIRGLYIGHSIISRAVFVGMERAVREMKVLIQNAGRS